MTVVEHLAELRRRLIVCVLAVFGGFCIAYTFSERLLCVLIAPIQDALGPESSLAMLKVQEAFVTHIKVAFVAGLIAAFPVVIHQIWAFVLPALKKKEAKVGLSLILSATVLFLVGILFAYFGVMPYAFTFFLKSAEGIASPTISLGFYINFSARMLLAFGVVFQLPLVIVFLVRTRIATIEQIKKARRYAIVVIFVVAAILTPPDVLTQLFMALPLIVLYEISILAARLFVRRD